MWPNDPQKMTAEFLFMRLHIATRRVCLLRIGLHTMSNPGLVRFQIGIEGLLILGQRVQVDLLGRVVPLLHGRPLGHTLLPLLDVVKLVDLHASESCIHH